MVKKVDNLLQILIDGTVCEQPLTGVAKATLGLYQGLLEVVDSLEVTLCHHQPLQGEIPIGMKTLQIAANNPQEWRSVAMSSHVRQSNYDVIHFPWNSGIPANLPSQVLKVLTLHDVLPVMIPNYFRNPLRKIQYKEAVRSSLRRADIVITDSQYSRQQILDRFRPKADPLVVYPASPLTCRSTPCTNTPLAVHEKEFFLFCGGYDKRKGIELLLRTFVKLWQRDEFRIPIWLAGASREYSPRLSSLLREARSTGAIKELGYVSDEELARLYSRALALIYPSRYEGFGLPPLEAMSSGCPVVTYPLTSLPEVCGEAALYIDPKNDNSLEHLILELSCNQELRARLSKSGLHQASQFSWHQSARIFWRAIQEGINNNHSSDVSTKSSMFVRKAHNSRSESQ